MTHEGAPAVFVIHEVAAVRPSWVRGLWKDFRPSGSHRETI